jgi:hypothetical protein
MQKQPLLVLWVAARLLHAGVSPKELMMSRLRLTFMTAAMLLALAALTLNSLAQPPGRGGGGGGGGRGGFGGGPGGGFGGPGGGFGGFGGGSLLQLASNPGIQEELKLKDKQKAQIKSLNDKYNAQMQEFRGQFAGPGGPGGPQGKGQGRGGNGNGQNGQNGQGGGGGGGGFGGGGGQGQDPNAQNGGGGGRGNRGNRNQNGQGIPEDPEVVAQRNEQRQMAREAMNELRVAAESSLAKILDRGQVTRLKQISLQLEGTPAVLCQNVAHPHGDMIDKLQIDDAQIEMIRESMNENRTAERVTRKSRGEMMKAAFARLNPNGANGAQANAGNGDGGGAGNNGNGNNGRNGGGRGGRGNFDPEAMRKVMESPEVKAQMEEIQSQEEKLTAQLTNAIYKIMSPRQRTTFKKMLGAPFDRSAMGGGGPWGGRGGAGRGGNNQATAKTTTTTATDDDDDDAPKAKPSTVAAPAKAKASASAAAAKKKSLREQRGVPSDDN